MTKVEFSEELYRAADVAKMFGISVPTVWKWTRLGKLPSPKKLSHRVTVWKKSDLLPALTQLLA